MAIENQLIHMKSEARIKMYQDLLDQVNYSGEIYEEAANSIHTESMKHVFKSLAAARKKMAVSLKEKVILIGGRPGEGLILRTPLHKTWIKVRSAIIEKNVPMILQDCIKAEGVLINKYETYLQQPALDESDKKLLSGHVKLFNTLKDKFSEKKSNYTYE